MLQHPTVLRTPLIVGSGTNYAPILILLIKTFISSCLKVTMFVGYAVTVARFFRNNFLPKASQVIKKRGTDQKGPNEGQKRPTQTKTAPTKTAPMEEKTRPKRPQLTSKTAHCHVQNGSLCNIVQISDK